MGDLSLGTTERSGTPLETRGAAGLAGLSIEDLFRGQGERFAGATTAAASPLQRLGTQAQQNLLGMEVGDIGSLGDILGSVLADPGSQTSDLFSALQPFEERETARQVAGLRGAFGQQGGRFSENLLQAEGELRGELGSQFRRSREEALLSARDRQLQGLGTALRSLLGAQQLGQSAGSDALSQILGFAQPGPPIVQQGLLPGLLQAGANFGGLALTGGLGGFGGGGGGGGFGTVPRPPSIPAPRNPTTFRV